MNRQSSPGEGQPAVIVAVVTAEPLGASMAGPAIRSVELARALARAGLDVRLCGPAVGDFVVPGVEIRLVGGAASLRTAVDGASAIVVFAGTASQHPWLFDTGAMIIVDAYDPELFETLERFRGAPLNEQRTWVADAGRHQIEPLRRADAVMVASDRQRHLVLGQLAALGRLGPRVLAEDPRLDRLVVTVPFGIPEEPPTALTPATSVRKGLVSEDAFVALWGGGLYDWLDPLTFAEALGRCAEPVIGVFLAGPHPSPAVGQLPLVDRVRARAAELGLGERAIFVDEWVPYAERARWLLAADVGVSLHPFHVETEFAFRTRILDYLWASLPVVCTAGDVLSDLVADRGLGHVVAAGDADGVAAALDALAVEDEASTAARQQRTRREAAGRRWSIVAEPLVARCRAPALAPDRRVPDQPPGGYRTATRRWIGRAAALVQGR